jgi:hypothetical protein
MPLTPDLELCGAHWLPRSLSEVQRAAAALALMVRGGPQFSAASPVAGDAAATGSVGVLLLGMGSARAAASSVVGGRRMALPALFGGSWRRLKVMVVVASAAVVRG